MCEGGSGDGGNGDEIGQAFDAINSLRGEVTSLKYSVKRGEALTSEVVGVKHQLAQSVQKQEALKRQVGALSMQTHAIATEVARLTRQQEQLAAEQELLKEGQRRNELETRQLRKQMEFEDAQRAAQLRAAAMWFALDRATHHANARGDQMLRWLLLLVARYELARNGLSPEGLHQLSDKREAQKIVDRLNTSIAHARDLLGASRVQVALDFKQGLLDQQQIANENAALVSKKQELQRKKSKVQDKLDTATTRLQKDRGTVSRWLYDRIRKGGDEARVPELHATLREIDLSIAASAERQLTIHASAAAVDHRIERCSRQETALSAFIPYDQAIVYVAIL